MIEPSMNYGTTTDRRHRAGPSQRCRSGTQDNARSEIPGVVRLQVPPIGAHLRTLVVVIRGCAIAATCVAKPAAVSEQP